MTGGKWYDYRDLVRNTMAYARRVVESHCPAAGARKAPRDPRAPCGPVSAHLRWHSLCPAYGLSVERHPTGRLRPQVHGLGPLQAVGGGRGLSASLAAGVGLLGFGVGH